MKPNEIRAEFIRKDIKLKSVADRLEITAPSVSAVISGSRRNPRIRAALAEALGRPVDEIWPPVAGPE